VNRKLSGSYNEADVRPEGGKHVKRILGAVAVAAAAFSLSAGRPVVPLRAAQDAGWPAVSRETRPWTRWWWMGSAVDRAGLSADLESLHAVGLGGVEITPIYGVAGTESQFIPYLSNEWVGQLEYALREAARLDLGVDMATGTGWPFGGPWVGALDACRNLTYRTWTLEAGARLNEPVTLVQRALVRATGNQIYEVAEAAAPAAASTQAPRRPGTGFQISDLRDPVETTPNLQALALEQVRFPKPLPLAALVAYSHSRSGEILDLTSRVSKTGTLDWVAPAGTWTIYGVFFGWHGKLVERAAPGGEGNVIDHFSRDAIHHYLGRFDRAFAGHPLNGLRAFFNDSYEVDDAQGQADATPGFFSEFQRRRGYDLRRRLPDLFDGTGTDDISARVLADYRQTTSELLLDTFTTEWRAWAKARGAIVRNQAHGSPANLLDLYAASDIPETEGTEIQRFKWATSAAHVAGRRLVSAEAATWLGEHFRVTLAEVRAAVDRFFVAGVNHIVYHGTAYSPPSDPWPGWQFYASVEFNSRNSWWTDFAALNQYVTRVQSFLQAGTPDHDVLVYYPFYDRLTERGPDRLMHFGGANPAGRATPFEDAAATLQRRGYTYDFISDAQLATTRVSGRQLVTSGGASYKTLVVPSSRLIPLETFDRILALARDGANVIAFKGLAEDVAGMADLANRRSRFKALRETIAFGTADQTGIREARAGRGAVLDGGDLEQLLARAGISRETLVDHGLEFTRRKYGAGRAYFIVNTGERDIDSFVPLDDRASSAAVFDPVSGRRGDLTSRRVGSGTLEVQVSLPRGASIVVATGGPAVGTSAPFFISAGQPFDVTGPWRVGFTAGGPELPAERTIERLSSWTTWGGDALKEFSGTARYTTTFRRPAGNAAAWQLGLGRVHESARVLLNGRELGVVIGPLFRFTIDTAQLADDNVLEVRVSNLMANRIAAMDRAGVRWRKFYNVNFPSRLPQNRGRDGLFSAAAWEPLDSGLIGPVTLTPVAAR
jgi:hypothetical protein